MKNLIHTLILLVAMTTSSMAQFEDHVKQLDVTVGSSKSLSGSLSEGRYIDLRFGMRSSVGCFTELEKKYFNGHHVLYTFKVPAHTKVLVELNTRGDMSIYGYMIPANRYDVPPTLQNISNSGCSASHNPMGELDRVMLKAGDETMNVVIGVTGIEESDTGAFNLKVTTRK